MLQHCSLLTQVPANTMDLFRTLIRFSNSAGLSRLISLINAKPDLSSKVICLIFGMSLYLYPCLVYVSSDGSGDSAHMSRIAGTFAAH